MTTNNQHSSHRSGDTNAPCGCSEFDSLTRRSLTRRSFMQGAAALTGAGVATTMFGSTSVSAAVSSTGSADQILVVLSLRGGADGLSLVVPHGDPMYTVLRPRIKVEGTLLGADEMFGLHPRFEPLRDLWEGNHIAAIQAVGLAAPNRSHFAAMELIEDADPGSPERIGWLNRLVSLDGTGSASEAINMGSSLVPTSLYGSEPVLAVRRIKDMYLPARDDIEKYQWRVASLRKAWSKDQSAFGGGARAALDLSLEFETLVGGGDDEPHNDADYPGGELGSALAETARMIRSDIPVQVITLDAGAWDMHVDLKGNINNAVTELGEAIQAFFVDLGPAMLSRVTVVTISEFGRRVMENGNAGLDHGWGNAMMVIGAGVKGGYYGRWPGLAPDKQTEGDLRVTNDYRSVLCEVVRSRLGADTTKVFPGFVNRGSQGLGFMNAA